MVFYLGLYIAACMFTWNLSRRLQFALGSRTSVGVLVANIVPLLPGVPILYRIVAAPVVLFACVKTTSTAFHRSDEERRDRELSEEWTKVGMASAGIGVLEAVLLAFSVFIWLGMRARPF